MKKLIVLAFALAFVIAANSLVYAQAKTPAKSEPPKAGVVLKWGGTVLAVDTTANTLTMRRGPKCETFQVGKETKITIAKKEAKLADVVKNKRAVVSYIVQDTKKVATAIEE